MNMKFLEFIPEGDAPGGHEILEAKELESGVIYEHLGETSEINAERFRGCEADDYVAGDPEEDMENWHMQETDTSCAVVCQEYVAEQLLDREFSEEHLREYAERMGWYEPETGTTPEDMGKILASFGLEVEQHSGLNLSELGQMLENGEKVICGVSSMILKNPDFAELPGINADHAVQVIGIDYADPDKVQIILNDPGVPDGQGVKHDLSTFMSAWSTSGNYAVSAERSNNNG